MNTYLQTMKNALTSYYNAARACEEKAQEARKIYQQDVASEVVKKLFAQLQESKAAAINAINDARDKAIEAAYRWGIPDNGHGRAAQCVPKQLERKLSRNRRLFCRPPSRSSYRRQCNASRISVPQYPY